MDNTYQSICVFLILTILLMQYIMIKVYSVWMKRKVVNSNIFYFSNIQAIIKKSNVFFFIKGNCHKMVKHMGLVGAFHRKANKHRTKNSYNLNIYCELQLFRNHNYSFGFRIESKNLWKRKVQTFLLITHHRLISVEPFTTVLCTLSLWNNQFLIDQSDIAALLQVD